MNKKERASAYLNVMDSNGKKLGFGIALFSSKASDLELIEQARTIADLLPQYDAKYAELEKVQTSALALLVKEPSEANSKAYAKATKSLAALQKREPNRNVNETHGVQVQLQLNTSVPAQTEADPF